MFADPGGILLSGFLFHYELQEDLLEVFHRFYGKKKIAALLLRKDDIPKKLLQHISSGQVRKKRAMKGVAVNQNIEHYAVVKNGNLMHSSRIMIS